MNNPQFSPSTIMSQTRTKFQQWINSIGHFHFDFIATEMTTDNCEYVKIIIENQDSMIEPDFTFCARRAVKATQARRHYITKYTNSLVIDDINPFTSPYENSKLFTLQFDNGLFRVTKGEKSISEIPTFDQYKQDLSDLFAISGDAALKAFCFKRITFLKYLFQFHLTLNGQVESLVLKRKCRKDFFHVEKVDQHLSFDSFFSAQTLLNFIIAKYNSNPNDIVDKDERGNDMTLANLLKRMCPEPTNMTIDFLDVQADRMMHRQDLVESQKEKIGGGKKLRKVFLSVDSLQKGLYFSEFVQQINKSDEKTFSYNEIAIAIFGKNQLNWKNVSKWVCDYKIYSPHTRYIITTGRHYAYHINSGIIKNFAQYLEMIFRPIFEVTLNPDADPALAKFLLFCTGFGLASMENTFGVPSQPNTYILPSEWTSDKEPDFEYYMYWMYANIKSLNDLRVSRGLNPLLFKPHAGESVRLHLASAFLLADSVHNCLQLKHTPVLSYFYYLAQVGISLAPLNQNKVILDYAENPFPELFKMGQNVTLATHNPLNSHYTQEHLLEEYSVAQQIWGFTRCDQCEISKNSCMQSGYETNRKQKWLGSDYTISNDQYFTNVPNIRATYRHDTLVNEISFVEACVKGKKH